jgi:hypothetical protein
MFRLAPAAVDPDIAAALVYPAAVDPDGSVTGRGSIGTRDPDVAGTVPAMVAMAPGPIGMSVGARRNDFAWRYRWPDPDDDLGIGDTCGKEKTTNGSEKNFFHRAISFVMLLVERPARGQVVVKVPKSYLRLSARRGSRAISIRDKGDPTL